MCVCRCVDHFIPCWQTHKTWIIVSQWPISGMTCLVWIECLVKVPCVQYTYTYLPATFSFGSEANEMTVFPAGTSQAFQEKKTKTARFSLILCFSVFFPFYLLALWTWPSSLPCWQLVSFFRWVVRFCSPAGSSETRWASRFCSHKTPHIGSPSARWLSPKPTSAGCPSTNRVAKWSSLSFA